MIQANLREQDIPCFVFYKDRWHIERIGYAHHSIDNEWFFVKTNNTQGEVCLYSDAIRIPDKEEFCNVHPKEKILTQKFCPICSAFSGL